MGEKWNLQLRRLQKFCHLFIPRSSFKLKLMSIPFSVEFSVLSELIVLICSNQNLLINPSFGVKHPTAFLCFCEKLLFSLNHNFQLKLHLRDFFFMLNALPALWNTLMRFYFFFLTFIRDFTKCWHF